MCMLDKKLSKTGRRSDSNYRSNPTITPANNMQGVRFLVTLVYIEILLKTFNLKEKPHRKGTLENIFYIFKNLREIERVTRPSVVRPFLSLKLLQILSYLIPLSMSRLFSRIRFSPAARFKPMNRAVGSSAVIPYYRQKLNVSTIDWVKP